MASRVTTIEYLCQQAISLVRGKRLILNASELTELNELDYEALGRIHAQDEAVVCAMNFERVRDRLLQLYPWTFARRTYSFGEIIDGVMCAQSGRRAHRVQHHDAGL